MPKPSTYKLCHTHGYEGDAFYLQTTMRWQELFKLIKIWEMKLSNVVPEYDWSTEDMAKLLVTFGCKQVDENAGFKSCWKADLYEIWETANTWYSDEELNDPKYWNEEAQKVFEDCVADNIAWAIELERGLTEEKRNNEIHH